MGLRNPVPPSLMLFAEAKTDGEYLADGDGENCAWFVPLKWTHTVSGRGAVWEVGFFGNQNSVAKPKSEKWEHTVGKLKSRWGVS